MKGYKATDKDGKCRDLEIKVGKTLTVSGELKLCSNGIHFCSDMLNVYNYYSKEGITRIFEVEALGTIATEGDKSATDKLKVIRELSANEILDAVLKRGNSGDGNSGYGNSGNRNSGYGNSGNRNSGYGNSGNRNSGYGNSGNRNSGDWNSGDWNSGDGNSGYGNSGNRNSGYGNRGYGNSGYGNSGNRNSGDWNSGDGNSGYFNTTVPVYFFNKPSDKSYTKELENRIRSLNVKPILEWVSSTNMTEQEKKDHPSYKTTEGFLRKTERMSWNALTNDDKKFIKSLPNYDDKVFQVISNGVSLVEPTKIEVTHNGQTFKIDIEKAKELGIIK